MSNVRPINLHITPEDKIKLWARFIHWYKPIVYPALTAASSHLALRLHPPASPSLVLPFGNSAPPFHTLSICRTLLPSLSLSLARIHARHPGLLLLPPALRPFRGASCIRYTKMHYYVDTYTNSIPREPRHVTSWYMIREVWSRCGRVTRIQDVPRNVSNTSGSSASEEFRNLFRKHLIKERKREREEEKQDSVFKEFLIFDIKYLDLQLHWESRIMK